jgi:hypothetical protein
LGCQPIKFFTSLDIPQTSSNSSSEHFSANFVVQPDFSKEKHKPKLEFVPRFERRVFEFMVPEGRSEESSLVAVIPFYRRFEDPSPKFQLVNDSKEWFSLGEIKYTVVSFLNISGIC